MSGKATQSFAVLLIACMAAASSAEEVLVQLKQPPSITDSRPKLSPMLIATKDSGGVLKGTDPIGQPVIAVTDDNRPMLIASAMVQSIGKAPAEYLPVTRLKISYKAGAKPNAADLERLGLKEVEDYPRGSFLIAEPYTRQIDAALASKLVENSKVQFVTASFRVRAVPPKGETAVKSKATASPPTNDTKWGDLWGMRNIHAPAAWKKVHDSPAVVVAVIDTGLNYDHEDLKGNIWSDAAGKHG